MNEQLKHFHQEKYMFDHHPFVNDTAVFTAISVRNI